MYKVVVDANVWIKYARIKNIAPLLDLFMGYNFLPVVNNYLLSEIFNVVSDNKWMHPADIERMIHFIRKIADVYAEKAVYALSPDPKDNYLFDLAVQNSCIFIISDDTELLHFNLKPVPVHSTNWFLKTFPV